jgi:hypothetical protein
MSPPGATRTAGLAAIAYNFAGMGRSCPIAARHRVSRGPLRAPGSPKNRTCEFPRIRLKPFRRPLSHDPAEATLPPQPLRYALAATVPVADGKANRLPFLGGRERTRWPRGHPPSAFSLSGGSSSYLATKDPSDVGSLSRPVMLQPVSAPLQRGVRFFRHLKPAPRSACLAAHPSLGANARQGRRTGFPRSAVEACVRLGTCCRPVSLPSTRRYR